jgi:hypothetical protein
LIFLCRQLFSRISWRNPDIESMVYWNHMLYQVKSQWFC